jgi:hypothetical protein
MVNPAEFYMQFQTATRGRAMIVVCVLIEDRLLGVSSVSKPRALESVVRLSWPFAPSTLAEELSFDITACKLYEDSPISGHTSEERVIR